jgi:hypothetical protein
MQNSANLLRDLKSSLAAASAENEAARAVAGHARRLARMCEFYAHGIDAANARIVRLLVARLRHAEAACADEYLAKIDEALAELDEIVKTEQQDKADKK